MEMPVTELIYGRNDHVKTPTRARLRQVEAEELVEARREAAEQTKAECKAMLAKAYKLGTGAHAVAVSLLTSDLTMDEILHCAEKVPSETSESVHRSRPGAITAIPAPRLANRPEEEAWLREARAHAEEQWARAHGAPIRQDIRSPADFALHEACSEIAMKAAGLIRDPDTGQKRFNSARPDQEDERLFLAGQESARRLWPGR
jgi:hypothetical protein